MPEKESKTCFVIAPIGDDGSETRKRSDQILKHLITPAVQECGFDPLRADKIAEPGIITSQVIQHIVDDPIVIADLTGRNPNVFYELAVRHAIAKPVVQIIQKGESIPFDVAVTRTIQVDHRDLDSVATAQTELVKQIKSSLKDARQVDSPISIALNINLLRNSSNPEDKSLSALIEMTSSMRYGFDKLEHRFSDMSDRLLHGMEVAPSQQFPRSLNRETLRNLEDLISETQALEKKERNPQLNKILNLLEQFYRDVIAR